VDETKTQSFSPGCHTVNIGLTESKAGNTTLQVLGFTCQ